MADDPQVLIADPVTYEWYCPNEPEDKNEFITSYDRHENFVRDYEKVVRRAFLTNGRQWAFDGESVIRERPASLLRCQKCGAKAETRKRARW